MPGDAYQQPGHSIMIAAEVGWGICLASCPADLSLIQKSPRLEKASPLRNNLCLKTIPSFEFKSPELRDMAEAIAIIGLVDATLSLGSKLYAFVRSVRGASKEIKALLEELQELNTVFPLVKSYIEERCLKPSGYTEQDGVLQTVLRTTLQTCMAEFKSLLRILRRLETSEEHWALTNMVNRVAWTFKAGDVEKATLRLGTRKQALSDVLSLSGR